MSSIGRSNDGVGSGTDGLTGGYGNRVELRQLSLFDWRVGFGFVNGASRH
jgi:hypothetical protein